MIPARFAATGTQSDCLMHCTGSECSIVCYLDGYGRVSPTSPAQGISPAACSREPVPGTRHGGTAA